MNGSDPNAPDPAPDAPSDTSSDTSLADAPGAAPPDARAEPEPVAADAVAKVARPYRLQFEQAQDAWVLLYPEGMVKLNRSAGEILSRCDGERPASEVVALVEEAFGQTGLERDIRGFLGVAAAQQWVTLS